MWATVAKHLLRSKVRLCSLNVQRNKKFPCSFLVQISRGQHSAPVYDQTAHTETMIQHIEVLDSERLVCVHWKDAGQSLYPYVWLRDNCQCPKCFLRSAKARKLPIEDLDVNTGLDKVNLYNGKKVIITWPDEHQSEFDAEWLKKRCFSKEARAEMQEELFLPEHDYWGSNLKIPTLSYEEVLRCDPTAYNWLCTLKKSGIVLLDGAPVRKGELVTLGKRIGYMRHTFYGYTWQVQDKVDANNVAYTSGKLSLHTDYPALHYPPGVQFLHCLKQSETGGESEVVDGFHVCNKLKEQNPDAFRILTSTQIDFTDIGVDYCDFSLQSKQRIIELDQNGELLRINLNNATRDSILNIPAEKVQPFYSSLKEFVNLLNRPENIFCFKMKPGQVITFDNWRIMHGRRSYQSGTDVSRHLEGSYLDWDVVMSRLRALKTKLQTSN
ncbi:PREDICTED: gamma-butyrobetaine dioxygenase isoform X2 [Nanorana parkeri]|uniref:gamma-butyrobetaine dioxygenase isoform X1 n=1 Tax=Nanorana parkeri TaxID=125878 RepID=UPI0008545243|nr:PREDICTED: gamma-butyrobetaine dioxygenase isoform X1 [Nanorana parkeri]XP_018419593.1 PREDICTED: gamma-butyrobetaine dioxygenase isoform X2 [Nanorana parkeri]